MAWVTTYDEILLTIAKNYKDIETSIAFVGGSEPLSYGRLLQRSRVGITVQNGCSKKILY